MAKILIVSPTPFAPKNAGNRARIANLIELLEQLHHRVYFLHVAREAGDPIAMQRRLGERFFSCPYSPDQANTRSPFKRRLNKALRKFDFDAGYQVSVDAWYQDHIGQHVQALCQQHSFDVVMVEYVYLSKVLDCLPDSIVKVIDTHDVFANRHRKYLDMGLQPAWFSCSIKDENRGLNRADIVCAIQEGEARQFSSRIKTRVVTLGYLPSVEPLPLPHLGKTVLLYIGSSNPINKTSIEWFLQNVWPLLRKKPNIELLIAGTVCNELAETEQTVLLGGVENLSEVYAKSTIVINPAQFGSGLKIKSVESLAFGRPLVATSTGLDGLVNPGAPAWIEADTPEAFASAIQHLAACDSTLRDMSKAAVDFVSQYCSESVLSFRSALDAALLEKKQSKGTKTELAF